MEITVPEGCRPGDILEVNLPNPHPEESPEAPEEPQPPAAQEVLALQDVEDADVGEKVVDLKERKNDEEDKEDKEKDSQVCDEVPAQEKEACTPAPLDLQAEEREVTEDGLASASKLDVEAQAPEQERQTPPIEEVPAKPQAGDSPLEHGPTQNDQEEAMKPHETEAPQDPEPDLIESEPTPGEPDPAEAMSARVAELEARKCWRMLAILTQSVRFPKVWLSSFWPVMLVSYEL